MALVCVMTLIGVSYGPFVSYDSDWLAGLLGWLAGWLAGWLMLHRETRFKFSRYPFIFKDDKTNQHNWLAG